MSWELQEWFDPVPGMALLHAPLRLQLQAILEWPWKEKKNTVTEMGIGYRCWTLVDDDYNLRGIFSVQKCYPDWIAEIGVNYFGEWTPRCVKETIRWAKQNLLGYNAIMCKVFEWNTSIVRIAKSFGMYETARYETDKGTVLILGVKTHEATFRR